MTKKYAKYIVLAISLLLLNGTTNGAKLVECESDDDCHEAISDFYTCQKNPSDEEDDQKVCVHKDLFPLRPREWIGTFAFAMFMCLANVGGIGGGGIAIPMCMYFFGFDTKPAIAVSSFSIMFSTIGRFLFNFNERHPEKKKMVAIDYSMTNVMMPLTLVGTLIGAFVYITFPDLLIQVILTLLLFVLSIASLQKAKEVYEKENKMIAAKREKEAQEKEKSLTDKQDIEIKESKVESLVEDKVNDVVAEVELTNVNDDIVKEGGDIEAENANQSTDGGVPKASADQQKVDEWGIQIENTGDPVKDKELKSLRSLVKQEQSHGIWAKQLLNLTCLAFLMGLSFLRGHVFDKCTGGDWATFSVFIVVMIMVVALAVRLSASEQALKAKWGNINLVESDLLFRGKTLCKVLSLGFFGGWVAGALGLGGGVIFNPLLLQMGVPPKVSSATGMYLITFSKIAACLIYIIVGELQVDYGLWVSAWSTAGAILGLWGANIYMAKVERQSIIVIILALVMVISTIGVPVIGGLDLATKAHSIPDYDLMGFKSLCE